MVENPQLKLAEEFIQYTGTHLFLTGRAGTGKTTFLHNIKRNSVKRSIVVAPTGVAAINAGGVTIHSFFQLPFGPFIPGSTKKDGGGFYRMNKTKKKIIKSLDLLIIDEISMVRSDMLDAVDDVLRRFRNKDQPFGGVQLLMIGDLQQLSPVVKEDERVMLQSHYDTPYFFGSRALQQTNYICIELQHIYRQKDKVFIELLNKIRENKMDNEAVRLLNTRY